MVCVRTKPMVFQEEEDVGLVSGQGPKVPPGTRSVPLVSGLVVESGELMKLQTPSMTKARKLLETLLSGQRTRHGREQLECREQCRAYSL